MLRHHLFRNAFAGAALVVFLAACDDPKDKAQSHFERGTELVEAGELEKATLEFRNAIKLDGNLHSARLELARIQFAQNQFAEAVSNFQRLAESRSNEVEAYKTMGQIFLLNNQVDLARPSVDAAYELAPDDLEIQALRAMTDYLQGKLEDAMALAQDILAADPGNASASRILAEQKLKQDLPAEAMVLLDDALALSPEDFGLHLARLRAFEALEDSDGIGAQIQAMHAQFPDMTQVTESLVRWYVSRDDIDAAEAVLRAEIDRLPQDSAVAMNLVTFLQSTRGNDTARAELTALIGDPDWPDSSVFVQGLANIDLQEGKTDEATTRLEGLLTETLPDTRAAEIKNHLAWILRSNGNTDRALALTQEVLAADPDNTVALIARAEDALSKDEPEGAIADLRRALDGSPQNPRILTLLADAHESNGSRGLANERLALAVRASRSGVAESLKYADFLARDGKLDIAEGVLNDAMEKNPNDAELMIGFARLMLAMSNWTKAEEVARTLRDVAQNDQARAVSEELLIAALSGQEEFEEAIGLLQGMWATTGETSLAMEGLVRLQVQSGRPEEARGFLMDILSKDPTDLRANLLLGAIDLLDGAAPAAEARFRNVIEQHPDVAQGYSALIGLLNQRGRRDEVDAVMQDGISKAANPERLMLMRAMMLEQDADFEGAIAVYEDLYVISRDFEVVNNNLASLLAEHRQDQESLDRASVVSKRLRSSQEPAFQDTFGWVLFRQGDYERALPPLQAAAEGLPGNPLVRFHLGMAYEKLGQKDRALVQLNRAIELADNTGVSFVEEAKAAIARLGGQ